MTEMHVTENFENQFITIIYESVMSCYSTSLKYLDQDTALQLIISALSKNLGLFLAHSPENLQENWNKLALHLASKSVLEATEKMASITYGQIGNA
jgi:hypothetical protein